MNELNIYDFPELKRPLIHAVIENGGQSAFARLLNISKQTVHAWIYILEKGIPPERCWEVETATDGRFTRKILRPDIFADHIETLLEKPKLTPQEEINKTIQKLQSQLKAFVYVDKWDYSREAQKIRNKTKKGAK